MGDISWEDDYLLFFLIYLSFMVTGNHEMKPAGFGDSFSMADLERLKQYVSVVSESSCFLFTLQIPFSFLHHYKKFSSLFQPFSCFLNLTLSCSSLSMNFYWFLLEPSLLNKPKEEPMMMTSLTSLLVLILKPLPKMPQNKNKKRLRDFNFWNSTDNERKKAARFYLYLMFQKKVENLLTKKSINIHFFWESSGSVLVMNLIQSCPALAMPCSSYACKLSLIKLFGTLICLQKKFICPNLPAFSLNVKFLKFQQEQRVYWKPIGTWNK